MLVAMFSWPLILQFIGLVNRDIVTYLQKYGESENFAWFDTVNVWPENTPALLVFEMSNTFNPNSQQTFEQTIHLKFRVGLAHNDRNVLGKKMRAYLGALTLLIAYYDWQRHAQDLVAQIAIPASLAELGATTPGVTANVTRIYTTSHNPDEFGERERGGFGMRATLNVVVNQEETIELWGG